MVLLFNLGNISIYTLFFSTLPLCAGITVDKHGFIYFVDGTMIRKIDENGVITTIIGSNGLTSTQPLSCDSGMDITQVSTRFSCVVTFLHTVEMKYLCFCTRLVFQDICRVWSSCSLHMTCLRCTMPMQKGDFFPANGI